MHPVSPHKQSNLVVNLLYKYNNSNGHVYNVSHPLQACGILIRLWLLLYSIAMASREGEHVQPTAPPIESLDSRTGSPNAKEPVNTQNTSSDHQAISKEPTSKSLSYYHRVFPSHIAVGLQA